MTSSDFSLFAWLHTDRKVRLMLCFRFLIDTENSKNIWKLHFSCSVFSCAKYSVNHFFIILLG